MTYDFILMNPPYSLGGKITTESKKHADRTVCLMPLSCYKKKSDELWRYVESMELADPKMFADADITNNLCICALRGSVVDRFKSYDDMAMESYDPKFKAFYGANSNLPLRYAFRRCDNAKVEDFDIDTDYVDSNRLVGSDNGFMDGGTSQGYIWNVLRRREVLNSGLSVITGFVKDGKDNFTKWAYSDCKNGLANKLLWGLGKQTVSSSCSIAIPQISWEAISETQLWKEGKYDEAVLSAMGLKWDGDVIVEKWAFENNILNSINIKGEINKMKIIKKIRSMIMARRMHKTCKAWVNVRKLLDEYIEKSCRLTFYIKPGYEEPTYFVGVSTVDEKEYNVSILDFGIISTSKIVEAVEAIQVISTIPTSFAVGDTNMKLFLQDNGVDNVIVDTKEHYEKVIKAIPNYRRR